ncbi:hypothetical protein [Streptomyces sp. WAC05374]|uniref:hypothetical protein n=1 Tax=Streptomyces sp. WAC05374 TaxID=2487420 RepID=UPI0021AE5C0D|nr:hypothetical protein [Streptomyces sp. WAC05374]
MATRTPSSDAALPDSEGLSKLYRKDRTVVGLVQAGDDGDRLGRAVRWRRERQRWRTCDDPEDLTLLCGPPVEVVKV